LVEMIGGRATPAVGMAFGIERVIEASEKLKAKNAKNEKIDVFLARLGEGVTKHALPIFERLRDAGISVRANFSKDGLKQQLEIADKLGVVYTVILGQKELLDGTIIIRDMENGIQEVVALSKIEEELKKRLKR
jgi:histidyl-tRNA synthetase